MRSESRARGAFVVIAATLLLLTAWVAVGGRSGVASVLTSAHAGETDRGVSATLSSVDRAGAIITPIPTGARISAPRLAPIWAMPKLVAALLTLCALRRLRDGRGVLTRRSFLRGGVSRRAPPLEAFA